MPKELIIKRGGFDVVVKFEKKEDLEVELKDIDEIIKTAEKFTIPSGPVAHVKPGFEDIYHRNSDGSVSILKPGGKTENVGIVLFAYDPEPLATELIGKYSGVKDCSRFLRSKYFEKTSYGKYKLSAEGLAWLTGTVIPKIR